MEFSLHSRKDMIPQRPLSISCIREASITAYELPPPSPQRHSSQCDISLDKVTSSITSRDGHSMRGKPEEARPFPSPFLSVYSKRINGDLIAGGLGDNSIIVKLRSVDAYHHHTSRIAYNVFSIELKCCEYSWIIRKRYLNIVALHGKLRLLKAKRKIPFSTNLPDVPKSGLAILPGTRLMPEKALGFSIQCYIADLVSIPALRTAPEFLEFLEVSRFSFVAGLGKKMLESQLAKRAGGRKVRIGAFGPDGAWKCFLPEALMYRPWKKRWLVLKDSYLFYANDNHCGNESITSVMLFDQEFTVRSGKLQTGMRHGLICSNEYRNLELRASSLREMNDWVHSIEYALKVSQWSRKHEHNSFAPVRSNSWAQWFSTGEAYMNAVAMALEQACEEIFIAGWWVSPELYLRRPHHKNEESRLDRLLLRKAEEGVQVHIIIYKEVEAALTINSAYTKSALNRLHENIHVIRHPDHTPGPDGVWLWAHHDKIVCVDQTVAFIGGIDLCFGRWDDSFHRLTDPSFGPEVARKAIATLFLKVDKVVGLVKNVHHEKGKDVPLEVYFVILGHFSETYRSATSTGTDPIWGEGHTLPMKDVTSPVVVELWHRDHFTCDTFIGRAEIDVSVFKPNDEQKLTLDLSPQDTAEPSVQGILHVQVTLGAKQNDVNFHAHPTWPGKDYSNPRIRDFFDLNDYANDSVDRFTTPRMPWQDIGVGLCGDAARDVGRHFILRLNFAKNNKRKSDSSILFLIPKEDGVKVGGGVVIKDDEIVKPLDAISETLSNEGNENVRISMISNVSSDDTHLSVDEIRPRAATTTAMAVTTTSALGALSISSNNSESEGKESFPRQRTLTHVSFRKRLSPSTLIAEPSLAPKGNLPFISCQTQIVRSCGIWSGGIPTENSIEEAYISAISNAEHFIYIENQFFVTSLPKQRVMNRIGDALVAKILEKHKAGKQFRVYVVMPLLPGFEGILGDSQAASLHVVMHWQYRSLSRGNESLLEKLREEIPGPFNYIGFFALRNWAELSGNIVTEQVYVHSKLMIVDDRVTIIGSSNINDRSMLGERDSEIAVVIHDTLDAQPFTTKLDDIEWAPGRFSYSLRTRIFQQHLGLIGTADAEALVRNPVSDSFYTGLWLKTAKTNTEVYDIVFRCLPNDLVHSWKDLTLWNSNESEALQVSNPTQARVYLSTVRGHLVMLPLEFLREENLAPTAGSKEYYIPTRTFT